MGADKIMARLEDSQAKTRVAAAKAISRVQPDKKPEASNILVKSLTVELAEYRAAAAEALEALEEAAVPHTAALVAALNDEDANTRVCVLQALQAAGRPSVKPNGAAVAELAKNDSNPYVRRAALAALRKFMLSRRYHLD